MSASDQYRYQGPGAPHLTPQGFIRLGRLQQALGSPAAGEVIDAIAGAGDDDIDFSAGYGGEIDLTGEEFEFTPDPDYDRVREFLAGAAIQLAEDGNEYALDTAEAADMDLDEYTAFAEAYQESFEGSYDREAQRQAEDEQAETELRLLGPKRSEDRLARALGRIEAGTYTPAGMYAAGSYGGDVTLCAGDDGFGRCSSAFHQEWCAHNVEHGATAGGSYEDAVGWRGALNRHAAADPGRRAAVGLEYPRVDNQLSVHGLARSLGLTNEPAEPVSARSAAGAAAQAAAVLRNFR
jgi:hypothetical protein